jgi:hypothetical protein
VKRTPQQFENDFFPGWEISRRSASPEHVRWREFLAEKQALIARVNWWRAPDLPQAPARGRAALAMMSGDGDADTADVFLQCVLFKEVVYG